MIAPLAKFIDWCVLQAVPLGISPRKCDKNNSMGPIGDSGFSRTLDTAGEFPSKAVRPGFEGANGDVRPPGRPAAPSVRPAGSAAGPSGAGPDHRFHRGRNRPTTAHPRPIPEFPPSPARSTRHHPAQSRQTSVENFSRIFHSSQTAGTIICNGPQWGGPLRSDDARHRREDTRR